MPQFVFASPTNSLTMLFDFEMQGVHPCDKRSSITKYRALFPAIDFSLVSTTSAANL
jgi:hypothetical protein